MTDESPSAVLGVTKTCKKLEDAKIRLAARSKLNPETGCHEWTGCLVGYGYGGMQYLGKKRTTHRLSWEFNVGPIPEGMCVLHRCDNPKCNNPAHLFIGTFNDNVQDCIAKKRRAKDRGTLNVPSKLSPEKVEQILKEYWSCDGRVDAITKKHGICNRTILNYAGKARRGKAGKLNSRAKLTPEIAAEIRRLHAEKVSQNQISKIVGLSWPTVNRVITGTSFV